MRIVIISDTHNLYKSESELPDGDILIHSGDFSIYGHTNEIKKFVDYFMGLKKYDTKIFIAGNHDLGLDENFNTNPRSLAVISNLFSDENLSQSDCVYLKNDSVIIQHPDLSRPIKIYGSPHTPQYGSWAFMEQRNGEKLKEIWGKIPDDTDILITHGPPHSILDSTFHYGREKLAGCELLYERVFEVNPLIHCFGHIHDVHGFKKVNNTNFINASSCNDEYLWVFDPVVFDIKEENGVLEATPIQI